jgi:hypothetical protein
LHDAPADARLAAALEAYQDATGDKLPWKLSSGDRRRVRDWLVKNEHGELLPSQDGFVA